MSQARRPMIAGNWKMNGLRAEGTALARGVADKVAAAGPAAEVVLCPPFTLLREVADLLGDGPVTVGGQDCHTAGSGAHTGDISAAMLVDAGCRYVILGHSERRQDHQESDALIQAKAKMALAAGLSVIMCIGETEAERDAGRTLEVVGGQIIGSLPPEATPGNTVIAYEPVWAIGTGRTATTEQVAEVHGAVREKLAGQVNRGTDMRILYGGSVKPGNARELLALEDVDGALVGGASLKVDDFWAIIEAAG